MPPHARPPPPFTRIIDTGTSHHNLALGDGNPNDYVPYITNAPQVMIPDGTNITACAKYNMKLPHVSTQASESDILPTFKHSLISVGQLCGDDCTAIFSKHGCTIYNKHETPVITGIRNPETGLYEQTTTTPKPKHHSNNTHCAQQNTQTQQAHATLPTKTLQEHIKYLHQCAFSPPTTTWIQAIKRGHFRTWPGVTVEAIKQYLPKSEATTQGHLDQKRKNVQSTKKRDDDHDTMHTPSPLEQGDRTHALYAATISYNQPTGKLYTNLTGRFPVQSSRGNKYILVAYNYDSNSIHVRPLKSRHDSDTIKAYQDIYDMLKQRGHKPQLHWLDNEASKALKTFIQKEHTEYQLTPPHIHRRNAAERAIRTFKNHFISGLCSVDKNFPLHLWCRLLDQAELTLNMLRTSRLNPHLSAHEQLHGIHDFNAIPLAPPGTKCIAHEKPSQRRTWAPHGQHGWYVGAAPEHYRCYTIYIPKTQGTRICDTVEFFPTHCQMPGVSPHDAVLYAAHDVITALTKPKLQHSGISLGNDQIEALRKLATIFQCSHETTPITKPGEKDSPPQHRPRTRSQTKALANTALCAPLVQRIHQSEPPPRHDKSNEDDMQQNHLEPIQHTELPHIEPIIKDLRPKFPTKHEGMVEDPFPLIREANAVTDPGTGQQLEYRQLINHPNQELRCTWQRSSANEFGRLAQGVGGRINGTDTIKFLYHHDMPPSRRPTYARFVCEIRPQKTEQERTRLTVGGILIDYPDTVTTRTCDLVTFKMHINSTLSRPNTKYCSFDVKNFYLNTPMERYEYMKIPIAQIPEEIINEYKLRNKVHTDGSVYIEIRKGMYGLPQAGMLANKLLKRRLAQHGYYEVHHKPGYWRHVWRPIDFTLVVDDFGVGYEKNEHALHLLHTLRQYYEAVTVDWTGTLYSGISLKWDYAQRTCELSMPGYVQQAVKKFPLTDKGPTKSTDAPHPYKASKKHGLPMTPPIENGAKLSPNAIKQLQQIVGTFLFYARAVDPTMLTALSIIATEQTQGTQSTKDKAEHFLRYAATHPNATIKYYKSDMILNIHSDTSYLSERQGRSRAGGHFYLGNKDNKNDPPNAPILNTTGILANVMSAASEAEAAALFTNMKEGVIQRIALEEMQWPQPPTPITVDNSTAAGLARDTIKANRSRAMDMRLHWIQDRAQQRQFNVTWAPGKLNKADYFTKLHAPIHHRRMHFVYLHPTTAPR